MKQYVLIVAGGKGERAQTGIPKQFAELNGKPLLMHTMEAFLNEAGNPEFIVCMPEGLIPEWKKLCQLNYFQVNHQIAEAGPKRFHSVKSGLKLVPENVLVAIHDAARPFVSKETIRRCFEMAARKGNAVPVVPLTESVREVSGVLNKAIERSKLMAVQTPQVFRSSLIKDAYKQNYSEEFTDDASVLEKTGFQINLVEGNIENIKITYPTDLLLAEQLFFRKTK
jgi:2-C-methyl-D-erythritol 4-phosphate cytidylyltransferase